MGTIMCMCMCGAYAIEKYGEADKRNAFTLIT